MLGILWTLLTTYLCVLLLSFFSTASLILCGLSWGSLPHRYLQVVLRIQQLLARNDEINECGLDLIQRDASRCVLARSQSTVTADDMEFLFDVDKENSLSLLEVSYDLTNSGLQAIVQDDVSSMFGYSPRYVEFELSLPVWRDIRHHAGLKLLYIGSLAFRILYLFPLRLMLLLSSFAFAAFWCIVVLFRSLPCQRKTWIAVVYSRLFSAGTGLVAHYHNPENKPTRPGIAVSNHLSPNDIQIISADVEHEREYLYTVTGQQHTGIIWAIERLVERLCPSLWFDRANVEDRKNFVNRILDEGRRAGPVLIFPEGYCTNNTKVLQFRKGVFVRDMNLHPIAIRQDARFGDSFWSEDLFYHYLFRLLTAWATVYDVYYLPVQRMREHESSDEFAARVQGLIANAIGATPAAFDGSVWYKRVEREKYCKALQEKCARQVAAIVPPQPFHRPSAGKAVFET